MNSARIEQLKTFLEDNPQDPFLHYALALEYKEDHPQRAAEIFRMLLSQHPGYLPAYYHAAHVFWAMEDLESARVAFENGIRLAGRENDKNTERELRNAYLNFQFETD